MYGIDLLATHYLNGFAGAGALDDTLMIWVSRLGIFVLVAAVALQWWRRKDRTHVRHVIVAAGMSFMLGLLLNQLVLLFFHRVRPYDAGVSHLIVPPSADFSFPSDHATAAMAIAAAFLVNRMPRTGLVFLAGALLMMFSRVYIGIHYASDVMGGALTGIVAALLVTTLYREGTRLDRFVTGIL